MKTFFTVAALALLLSPLLIAGLTSADYQAAIREATERYRGDCTEIVTTEHFYFYGSFKRDLCDKYLKILADFEFTLSLLPTVTPNQAIRLTADPRESSAPFYERVIDINGPRFRQR